MKLFLNLIKFKVLLHRILHCKQSNSCYNAQDHQRALKIKVAKMITFAALNINVIEAPLS